MQENVQPASRVAAPQEARREFLSGARDITPIALGVAIYGCAFGILAAQTGLNTLHVGIMGTIVFAGGSQIVATNQLLAGAGALAAVLAGVALNLRLLLITASIRDVFAGRPWWQVAFGAHVTADENWALMLAARARGRAVGYPYLLGGGVCLWMVWILSTVSGVVFAAAIPDPKSLGMDFAFTAAFIAIARSLWKGWGDLVPWLVAASVVVLTVKSGAAGPSWALILGGVCGAASAAVFNHD